MNNINTLEQLASSNNDNYEEHVNLEKNMLLTENNSLLKDIFKVLFCNYFDIC